MEICVAWCGRRCGWQTALSISLLLRQVWGKPLSLDVFWEAWAARSGITVRSCLPCWRSIWSSVPNATVARGGEMLPIPRLLPSAMRELQPANI